MWPVPSSPMRRSRRPRGEPRGSPRGRPNYESQPDNTGSLSQCKDDNQDQGSPLIILHQELLGGGTWTTKAKKNMRERYFISREQHIKMEVKTGELPGVTHSIPVTHAKGSNHAKKAASFWTFSKRGGGPTRIQKFWGSFFWAFFWTFSKEGGGGEPIPKVLG